MRKFGVLFCMFAIIFSFGILSSAEVSPGNRLKEINSLLDKISGTLDKIQDKKIKKEAKDLWQFLLDSKVPMMPLANSNVAMINRPKSKYYVGVLLLKKDDPEVQKSPLWKSLANNRNFAAAFNHDNTTIVLKDDFLTNEIIFTVLVMHEIFHAREYFKGSGNSFISEEIMAHSFENQLIRGFFGKNYQALLEAEKERIKNEIGQYKTVKDKILYLPDRVSNSKLNKAFGITDIEYGKMIGSSLWIDAIFSIAEETALPELKEEFLKDLYRRQKM